MVWFGLCCSSKVYIMEVDRREKSVEQSTNAILNPSARSENTFFMNCPVLYHSYFRTKQLIYSELSKISSFSPAIKRVIKVTLT